MYSAFMLFLRIDRNYDPPETNFYQITISKILKKLRIKNIIAIFVIRKIVQSVKK